MHSQRDEEKVILQWAGARIGTFLDIGAYNPTVFSNVRALYEKGWSGVLVEPSPECFVGLMNAYKEDPRITLVNAMIGTGSCALRKFYSSPDAVGTSVEGNYKVWKDHASFRPIYMPCIPVSEIFTIAQKFDFISIDAEGVSFEILRAIDLKAVGCDLVCVETDCNEAALHTHFTRNNFEVIHKTAENIIAARIK